LSCSMSRACEVASILVELKSDNRKRKQPTVVAPAELQENKCRVCRLLHAAASHRGSTETVSINAAVTDASDFDVLRCASHRNANKLEMMQVIYPTVYVVPKPCRFRGGGKTVFWSTLSKDLPIKLEFKTFMSGTNSHILFMITKSPLSSTYESILGLSKYVIKDGIIRVGDNVLYPHPSLDEAARKLFLLPDLTLLPLIYPPSKS
jgi:hypothetical protein